ncbi:MAG TPA: hypothetical protein PLP19_05225 [bacterium]|nr:hypothetical protein [bacterium]HPN42872.1 hypothetical protein [bacterium]
MNSNLTCLMLYLRRGGLHFSTLVKDKGQKPLVPGLETLAHFPHRDVNPGAISVVSRPSRVTIGSRPGDLEPGKTM